MNQTINFSYISEWTLESVFLFWAFHLVAFEIFQHGIIMNIGVVEKRRIEKRSSHLDVLSNKDKAFIVFNRLCVPLLSYGMIKFCHDNPQHVEWDFQKMNLINTVGSLVGFYIFYDFFYVLFHRLLHVRAFYPYVHKHHHRQHSPSRGNVDAVNVHPFEFIVGEFLHLLAVMAVPCHVSAAAFFYVMAGFCASLNHTRFDVRLLNGIYQVRSHDIHHRLPQTNYGQYSMFWDQVMGSFRSYEQSVKTVEEKE